MKNEEIEQEIKKFALDTAEDFGSSRSSISIEKLKELQAEVKQMTNHLAKPSNYEEFAGEVGYFGTSKTSFANTINRKCNENAIGLKATVRNGEIILKAI